jgi:hypothetical protein
MKWRLDQRIWKTAAAAGRCVARSRLVGLLALVSLCSCTQGAEVPAAAHFRKNVQPILEKYCPDCHADGVNKGGIAFDELKTEKAILDHDLWLKALKNTRAGLMRLPKSPNRRRKSVSSWSNGSSLKRLALTRGILIRAVSPRAG